MAYRILADLLVTVHLAFVLFVVLGGLLVLWRRRIAFFHLPAAVWGVLIELGGWICPLTPLEVRFRILGGRAGYSGGFVEHYIIPIIYPAGLTRGQQMWMGVLVGFLNLVVYGVVLWGITKERRAPP
jgi:hypothetical protein